MTGDSEIFKSTIRIELSGFLAGCFMWLIGSLSNDRTTVIISQFLMIFFLCLIFYAFSVRIMEIGD